MSRKKSVKAESGPSNARCAELATHLVEEHIELGPVDREDLVAALNELLQRRNVVVSVETPAPEADAA